MRRLDFEYIFKWETSTAGEVNGGREGKKGINRLTQQMILPWNKIQKKRCFIFYFGWANMFYFRYFISHSS